jgi:hypothetical protein
MLLPVVTLSIAVALFLKARFLSELTIAAIGVGTDARFFSVY